MKLGNSDRWVGTRTGAGVTATKIEVIIFMFIIIYLVLYKLFDWKSNILIILEYDKDLFGRSPWLHGHRRQYTGKVKY